MIDFTGTASTDFAIAILAGLNWLTHCAHLASVPPAQQMGTIRNFRKIVTVAQKWWLTEGATTRCDQLIANGQQPPLMLLVRVYTARKTGRRRRRLWILDQPFGEVGRIA